VVVAVRRSHQPLRCRHLQLEHCDADPCVLSGNQEGD
jgi:hypothetical protein